MFVIKFVCALPSTFVSDIFGRRTTSLTGLGVMTCGYTLLALSTSPVGSIYGVFASVLGYHLSLGPLTWQYVGELFPLEVARGENRRTLSFSSAWAFAAKIDTMEEVGAMRATLCIVQYFNIVELKLVFYEGFPSEAHLKVVDVSRICGRGKTSKR